MSASLEVVTASGDASVAFGPNHHIAAVVAEALVRVGLPADADGYQVVTESGGVIPLDQTVAGAGLRSGDTVVLEPNPTQI